MKFSLATVFLIIAAACTLHAQSDTKPPFEMPKQYSVDIVSNTDGMPDAKSTMKMYVSGNKMRMDMEAPQGSMGVISRGDTKKVYTLMVADKKYLETPYDEKTNPATNMFPEGTWTKLGTEDVNGVTAQKYKLVSSASGSPATYNYWVNTATNFPVRVVMEEMKTTLDFANFKAGEPAASLFELPADYTVIDMNAK